MYTDADSVTEKLSRALVADDCTNAIAVVGEENEGRWAKTIYHDENEETCKGSAKPKGDE